MFQTLPGKHDKPAVQKGVFHIANLLVITGDGDLHVYHLKHLLPQLSLKT